MASSMMEVQGEALSVGFSAVDPVDSSAGMMRLVKKVGKKVLFFRVSPAILYPEGTVVSLTQYPSTVTHGPLEGSTPDPRHGASSR